MGLSVLSISIPIGIGKRPVKNTGTDIIKNRGAVVAERSYSYNSYIDRTDHDFDVSRVRDTAIRFRLFDSFSA
jgi:hypothetical protein